MITPSNPRPHAVTSTTIGDPVEHRQPYTLNLDEHGAVRVYQGNSVMIGTDSDADGRPTAVSIAVAMFGCTCGCGFPGRALEFVPTPEHARLLASQLLEAASDVEAAAKISADVLLVRARGK